MDLRPHATAIPTASGRQHLIDRGGQMKTAAVDVSHAVVVEGVWCNSRPGGDVLETDQGPSCVGQVQVPDTNVVARARDRTPGRRRGVPKWVPAPDQTLKAGDEQRESLRRRALPRVGAGRGPARAASGGERQDPPPYAAGTRAADTLSRLADERYVAPHVQETVGPR